MGPDSAPQGRGAQDAGFQWVQSYQGAQCEVGGVLGLGLVCN